MKYILLSLISLISCNLFAQTISYNHLANDNFYYNSIDSNVASATFTRNVVKAEMLKYPKKLRDQLDEIVLLKNIRYKNIQIEDGDGADICGLFKVGEKNIILMATSFSRYDIAKTLHHEMSSILINTLGVSMKLDLYNKFEKISSYHNDYTKPLNILTNHEEFLGFSDYAKTSAQEDFNTIAEYLLTEDLSKYLNNTDKNCKICKKIQIVVNFYKAIGYNII